MIQLLKAARATERMLWTNIGTNSPRDCAILYIGGSRPKEEFGHFW